MPGYEPVELDLDKLTPMAREYFETCAMEIGTDDDAVLGPIFIFGSQVRREIYTMTPGVRQELRASYERKH